MKTLSQFLTEASIPKELQDRNAKIDFETIIYDAVTKRFPDAKNKAKELQDVIDYIKSKKVFSLGKLVDISPLPAGWLKEAIDAAKLAIDEAGFSKVGSAGSIGPIDRGAHIDRYLKQKWITK